MCCYLDWNALLLIENKIKQWKIRPNIFINSWFPCIHIELNVLNVRSHWSCTSHSTRWQPCAMFYHCRTKVWERNLKLDGKYTFMYWQMLVSEAFYKHFIRFKPVALLLMVPCYSIVSTAKGRQGMTGMEFKSLS